jgi:hypothetical protein
MELKDLIAKMTAIEEGKSTVDECGGMEVVAPTRQQSNNVSMNVNMTGTGPEGVRNLMDVIRAIEKAEQGDDHIMIGEPHGAQGKEEPIMGDEGVTGNDSPLSVPPEEEMGEELGDDSETWANSADGDAGHHTHGIDAVTFSGDDMNSKAKVSPVARAPGTNTLRQPTPEGLVERLSSLYFEVKTRDLKESVLTDHTKHTLQHILKTYSRDYRDFKETGDLSSDLFDALFDYYHEDMPYGVQKARTGDPHQWIANRLDQDAGTVDENLVPSPNPSEMMPAPATAPVAPAAPMNESISDIVKLSKMING